MVDNIEKMDLQFASQTTELSEYTNYLEITTRLCYLDKPNLNNVALVSDENSENRVKTLVDMPIQAKYTVNENGEPDFLDHCVTIDENGNYSFSTVSIGVHTDAWIADDTITTVDGEVATLPCIFAKAKIWKRYPNYCAAVQRLYESGRLATSWELIASKYEYDNGIKYISDYTFESNCLLGSGVCAAYEGTSKVLEMSAQDRQSELLVASALSADLIADKHDTDIAKEDKILETPKENNSEDSNVVIEESDATTTETTTEVDTEVNKETNDNVETDEHEDATLTSNDLFDQIRCACIEKLKCWGYIAFWFPNEMTVWFKSDMDETDLDMEMFTYTVDNDAVTVSDPSPVKLSVSVASINGAIDEKNEALIQANAKIDELNSQIESLSPFKAAYEEAQAEKFKAEKEAKIEKMRKDAEDSKCFSADELESEEFEKIFTSADESALKMLIADKVLEKLREDTSPTIETSSVKTDLVNDEINSDPVAIFKQWLRK